MSLIKSSVLAPPFERRFEPRGDSGQRLVVRNEHERVANLHEHERRVTLKLMGAPILGWDGQLAFLAQSSKRKNFLSTFTSRNLLLLTILGQCIFPTVARQVCKALNGRGLPPKRRLD